MADIIYGLLYLMYMVLMIWGVISALFLRGRRLRGLGYLIAGFVLFIVTVSVMVANSPEAQMAKDAGFESLYEYREAQHLGITTPEEWKAEQARQKAVVEEMRRQAKIDELANSFKFTLADYIEMKAGQRDEKISQILDFADKPQELLNGYRNCMGYMASEKNPDLEFDKVFGWCVQDEENAPEEFRAYFNELDAKDLRATAAVICTNFVEDRLASPHSAKFPWVPDTAFKGRRQAYVIKSYVDANNIYGVSIRLKYHCEVRYKGEGITADPRSWELLSLDIAP